MTDEDDSITAKARHIAESVEKATRPAADIAATASKASTKLGLIMVLMTLGMVFGVLLFIYAIVLIAIGGG